MAGEDRKNDIIQAASKIFSYYGYDKTTLEDIGKKVGLNKTSLYYYYKNKESIFADVLQSEIDGFLSSTMKKLESAEGCRDKILTYLVELLNYSRNAANLDGLSSENMQNIRPFIRSLSGDFMKKHIQYISEVLKAGVKSGVFLDCDTEKIAVNILKIANAITGKNADGCDWDRVKENEADVAEGDMRLMVSLVLDGLNENRKRVDSSE